jgi:chemotaxis signal transduction protein
LASHITPPDFSGAKIDAPASLEVWLEKSHITPPDSYRAKSTVPAALERVDRDRAMLPLHGLSTYDLERMSNQEFWNYAHERAGIVPQLSSQERDYQDQHLECELSRGNCFVPLKAIIEVVPPPHRFAQLPVTPGWMRGLVAWRGEVIAVIDLDMYLCGESASSPGGMLLVATHADITVGLLVPNVGLTATVQFEQMHPLTGPSVFYTPMRAGVVRGVFAEEPVLDVSALLPDVVQQIGMAAHYG